MNQLEIGKDRKITPFFIVFLVVSSQMGVGILAFQSNISQHTGNDAWLVVVLSSLIFHIVIVMMFSMLKHHETDLVGINQRLLGRWVGTLASLTILIYFAFAGLIVLRTYLEVLRAWIFPTRISLWEFSLAFCFLIIYATFGGIRLITGLAMFGIFLPIGMVFLLFIPIEWGSIENLFPMFSHPPQAFLPDLMQMTFSYAGIEAVLLYYPFLRQSPHSQKWAHLGLWISMAIYLFLILAAIMYFSDQYLQRTKWPTPAIWQVIQFPFLERFEIIGSAIWAMAVLPNTCIMIWCASRIGQRVFLIKQKSLVYILGIAVWIGASLIRTDQQLLILQKGFSYGILAILYGFIPLLFFLHQLRKWISRGTAS